MFCLSDNYFFRRVLFRFTITKPSFSAKVFPCRGLIARTNITNRALNDQVREMSFTPSFFASPGTFAELMLGQSRRIVVLTEDDVCSEMVRTLRGAKERAPFGVIVAADRASLRGVKEAELYLQSIRRSLTRISH